MAMLTPGSRLAVVSGNRIGIGLSWDHVPGSPIDLDLQAVAFDNKGAVSQAVYYNNLKAYGKGLTHSSDETTGQKTGMDETVWVDSSKIPQNVQMICFVLACYSGGHLRDVRNGKLQVMQNDAGNVVGQLQIENSNEAVDLVASLVRTGNGWDFNALNTPASEGRHFIDILEPTIGNYVRTIIPSAPRRIKACFAMDKGSVVDLPQTSTLKAVKAGLGWDTNQGEVDLDVSAIMLGHNGRHLDTVFFGNLEAPGVKHSGDNLTGHGRGDDEVIDVKLESVDPNVQQIFFVINIYTRGKSFAQVSNPFCRVITAEGDEFCKYQLADAGRENGLMVARLVRSPGDLRWGFQAIGKPAKGSMWKDTLPDVIKLAQLAPNKLQRLDTTAVGAEDNPLFADPAVNPDDANCVNNCVVS